MKLWLVHNLIKKKVSYIASSRTTGKLDGATIFMFKAKHKLAGILKTAS